MQAIILAAGMGKRLGELTKGNTKCMVKVNGIPLIKRMLLQLEKLALSRIVIVVGFKRENLKEYIATLDISTPITFVDNPVYDKTNNIYSLGLAQDYLQEEDTLLLESDLIFEDAVLQKLMQSSSPDAALVAPYESWMDGTVVRISANRNIVTFIPKSGFKYSEIDTYYKTVNIYKFSKEFSVSYYVPFLNAYMKAQGNNEYYEQVLRILTFLDQIDFKAVPLEGEKWYEIDDIQDLDIAETIFSTGECCLKKYFKRYGGYWRFPQMLDFCYLVNPYFPPPRMIEEMKSNFSTLLAEYPSGAEVNNLLVGKYFGVHTDLVCVGNGAAELIRSLMNMISGKLGVLYPTFEEYPNRFAAQNIVPFKSANPDFSYTADDLIQFFTGKEIAALLIVNPDNPSGNYIPVADLRKLIDWCGKEKIRLIVDESFVDFCDETDATLLKNDILETSPHLVVMKSISKSYGVPGLRLGVLATGDKELLTSIRKDISIWNINSFAEFYMQIFSKYEKFYTVACRKFREERERFFQKLQQIPFLRVYPSQANYFLAEVKEKCTSAELTNLLLEKYKILIKDCSTKKGFDGRNYIRIAVRNTEDNNDLIEALKEIQ